MSNIGWGVDGYGDKYYICDDCGEYFGNVDMELTHHKCKDLATKESEGREEKQC